jgi:WD40 repeat protein
MNFKLLDPSHADLVNDIVFDYYGKRFATCSSDKHIKVFTFDEEKQVWNHDDIPRAHHDSIWRLSWSHPEFGQLIASCSEDNTVRIWEEQETNSSNTYSDGAASGFKWLKKATLSSNNRRSVNDVKFSHRSLGLKLATVSSDGYLRIYDARDIFDLSHWDLYVSLNCPCILSLFLSLILFVCCFSSLSQLLRLNIKSKIQLLHQNQQEKQPFLFFLPPLKRLRIAGNILLNMD